MGKVTIEDISRRTGLSRGTVSRALNDRPDISTVTKQRVLDACQELNYVPSRAARSLATGRNFTVAVVVDDLDERFASSFLRGAMTRAEQANYSVFAVELGHDDAQRRSRMTRVANERVDTVLIAANLGDSAASILRQAFPDRPIASCLPIENMKCDTLVCDQGESGALVARHLFERCGNDILYVHSPDCRDAAGRLAGFQLEASGRGLDAAPMTLEVPVNADQDTLWSLLEPRFSQIRGIAATGDTLALGIMMAAMRAGRRPGRDLAIVGQGNTQCGQHIHPALTTTDFAGEETGHRAMGIMLQRLNHTRLDAPEQIPVAPSLIERESSSLNR
ncbi:MAG: LacI family DNA-binding transcriptional regulator [Phycisphaerae bacterium]|nr:LacI family DNA-binding transcriptional regulator [Phycisphaerae bacterium]